MVEDLLNFAISGIYSLMILSITFNFLLAMRLKQLQNRFVSYTETINKKIGILTERLDITAGNESPEKGSEDKPGA